MLDTRKFDKRNLTTVVNLSLLANDRHPLKLLAASKKNNHRDPIHARTSPKCRKCGLKRRRTGHSVLNDSTGDVSCVTH